MDLKSMLNDSAAQRPPRIQTHTTTYTHTPQSSYDARSDQTPSSDISSARPTPHGPPLQSIESRLQGGGGYFAVQSPHPTTSASASTPNTAPHSAYSQSPSAYPTSSTPKESIPPSYNTYNAPFVSPSASVHHPVTPGSANHPNVNHTGSHPNSAHTANYQHFQSPPPHPQANGLPSALAHARQISPTTQFHNQPATPLGPPINYPKISPHSHRPLSQGQGQEQHLRRGSQSSIGSVNGKEYIHSLIGQTDSGRRDSLQRSLPLDLRERERSISVSPKTIPRPPPSREQSSRSRTFSHGQSSLPPQLERQVSSRHSISMEQGDPAIASQTMHAPPVATSTPPTVTKQPSTDRNFYPSPAPEPIQDNPATQTPAASRTKVEEIMGQVDSVDARQSSLKRSASHLSDSPVRRPPKKRIRRDEVPTWAQSARGGRKLNFIAGKSREIRIQNSVVPPRPAPSTQPAPVGTVEDDHSSRAQSTRHSQPPEPIQPVNMEGLRWESTLADIVPYEDLTRNLCEFILHYVRDAVPPKDSFFEIEAKIGQIMHDGVRVKLPIMSEAIIDRNMLHGVRFDSNMHLTEHQALNEYLNELVSQSLHQRSRGIARHEILYDHPKENDEFFALSEEGKAHLDPSIIQWIQNSAHRSRGEVKVRRTVDKVTGQAKKTIIKTRIADLEINSPRSEFDYRISISLETDWDGKVEWLIPLPESRGRKKDRMSYRHMMYQVDLTQVTHDDDGKKEHELEIEISVEKIRQELTKLRNGEPTQYEEMIRGLIDNVRLLSRRASDARSARFARGQGGG